MEGMFLRVHTAPDEVFGLDVRVGDTFEIVDEDENLVSIMVLGYELAFTKEPDENGESYATWFDVTTMQ